MRSISPTTGRALQDYDETPGAEWEPILDRAHAAFLAWRRTAVAERSAVLNRAATILRRDRTSLARLMAEEMGKPVRQGEAEVDKCAWGCEFYAEHAEAMTAPEFVATDARRSFVAFEPLGVVLAVMPWNFPLWQVFRFAAPALMAGNAAVLKHASNVPGCALAVERVLHEAGVPVDLFRALLVDNEAVDTLLAHPRVVAVTLTGSERAGRAVARRAGELLKKSVLELGGSDAYVLLEDADLDLAVPICIAGRLTNSGQSCIAAKRFIVVEPLREEFERRLVEGLRRQRVGDPLDPATEVGPLARHDLRDELHRQVVDSVRAGARLLLGGEIPSGPGVFYPPTALTSVRPGMPAYKEELFGPVAAILPVRDETRALEVANDTPFGLGAAVFTRDLERGERIAATRLEAGSCFVNAMVKSDPRLPFGGIKTSGYGRELGTFGLREFVNIKTVYVG